MIDFSLFNETFSINKTSTYHLTIELSQNSYSYSIIDTIRSRFVALKHANFEKGISEDKFNDKVNEVLKTDVFLNKSYKSVGFIHVTQNATIIPEKLFDKNKQKEHFTLTHDLNDYEELHFNKISQIKAINLFSIPSYLTTLLVNKFPQIEFVQQATPFIVNNITDNSSQTPVVAVNVHNNFIDVIAFNQKHLLLYNTFKYINEDDFVYYIINVFKQLNMRSDLYELRLSGNINKSDNYFKLLNKFAGNIVFSKLSNSKPLSYSFDKIPEHTIYNLINYN